MTVSKIETAFDLVNEMESTGQQVGSVWEFRHKITKTLLFAVFPLSAYCDIHESSFCDKPIQIWRDGKWIAHYEFLNYG